MTCFKCFTFWADYGDYVLHMMAHGGDAWRYKQAKSFYTHRQTTLTLHPAGQCNCPLRGALSACEIKERRTEAMAALKRKFV